MYMPRHFEETRPEVLHELVRSHPLGLLITQDADAGLSANPVPFLLEHDEAGRAVLRAHVARANPVWQAARRDVESLVVFQGPQAYVSPGWYATKAEHGKVVPTWNYVAVHAYGSAEFFEDADRLLDVVTRLTALYEGPREKAWQVSDAPADFIKAQLRGIVGFRMPITRIDAKKKMSQNRKLEDRAGVIAGLDASDRPSDREVAAMIPTT